MQSLNKVLLIRTSQPFDVFSCYFCYFNDFLARKLKKWWKINGTKLSKEHQHMKRSNIWQPWIKSESSSNPKIKFFFFFFFSLLKAYITHYTFSCLSMVTSYIIHFISSHHLSLLYLLWLYQSVIKHCMALSVPWRLGKRVCRA